jgi:hypothetical protein
VRTNSRTAAGSLERDRDTALNAMAGLLVVLDVGLKL